MVVILQIAFGTIGMNNPRTLLKQLGKYQKAAEVRAYVRQL